MNSSLNLKISLNSSSVSRSLVFAICLVADLTHCYPRDLEFICEYQLRAIGGSDGFEKFKSEICLFKPEKKCIGDHVLILCVKDMVREDKNYEEASFEFYLKIHNFNEDKQEDIKVEKCGVHKETRLEILPFLRRSNLSIMSYKVIASIILKVAFSVPLLIVNLQIVNPSQIVGCGLQHKETKAAEGTKTAAQGLEHAIAGSRIYVVRPGDDVKHLREVKDCVLLEFLKTSHRYALLISFNTNLKSFSKLFVVFGP
ncbi:hypothetical protein V6N12_019552 [Hibiscus sabdariffa]|uniref:Uncharacterized protein n=1 Tax=Hibiscus sabdariffa TaxID=183260 RepID=A0ABR2BN06_9ROSI